MTDELTLEDTIRVTEVMQLRAQVSLEPEQIELLRTAFDQISRYTGESVKVRQIDEALSIASDRVVVFENGLTGENYDGQLLTTGTIKLTPGQKAEAYKRSVANPEPGVSAWNPMCQYQTVPLLRKGGNSLFFGLSYPCSIDGDARLNTTFLAKIQYERAG